MLQHKFEINILKKVYKDWSVNLYQGSDKTYLVVISYFDINSTEVWLFNNFKDAKNKFYYVVEKLEMGEKNSTSFRPFAS
jgi:SUMO ligase MMS21 Smc5/6 complex component